MTRHFLTGFELTREELSALIERALELKADRMISSALAGSSVALLFDRPSTRTRFSFEVGVHELGGHAVVVREGELQLVRGESMRDTAVVLSRFVQAIGIRTGPHALAEELAQYAGVPVINMLTERHHPCQALADLVTLRERFGRLEGLKLVYVGDGNNVAHSLMILGGLAGLEVVIASPTALAPDPVIVQAAERSSPGSVVVTDDPEAAAHEADALYTDVWMSMGDENAVPRREQLAPYQLGAPLLERARAGAVVLHCLPAHPGEEITEDVLYGKQSAVWDQAENRLHAQKALLELLCSGG